jgi:hypothetical protein
MWTTVVLAAALSLAPGENGQLTLSNVRSTYGILGAARSGDQVLPGDHFLLAFDIDGITADDSGKVLYSVGMTVSDSNGKVLFKQAPSDLEANNSLGGDRLPAYANVSVGLDQPPGEYTVKVTVKDRAAGTTKEFTKTFQVLPKGFGLVRVALTGDAEGHVPATALGEGQTVWINFAAVGFGRDGDKGRPNLKVALRVLGEDGRPTLAKAFTGEVNEEVPKNLQALPMQFVMGLNRPGKFSLELTAIDNVTHKKTTLNVPLTVMKTK